MDKKVSLLKKLTSKHWLIFLLITGIGIGFIVWGNQFPETSLYHNLFRDLGISLIPIGLMSFVYEYTLRENFMSSMKKTIEDSIEDRMPTKYKNMRDSGIIDVFPDLQIDKLKNHLSAGYHSEIRILDIWVENFTHIEDILVKAVLNNKCNVRILLWDIKNVDVLKRRAAALGKGKDEIYIMQNILYNLLSLKFMLEKIENEKKINHSDGKLCVKLYNSFIGISLFGYGSEFYASFYLREYVSSMGTQLKVSGNHHFFYNQLDDHFEKQWDDESNIEFIGNLYDDYKIFLEKYISDTINNKNASA